MLGNDDKLQILYFVSDYLDDDRDLLNIKGINKATNEILKPTIYRRCLLNVRNQMSYAKRSFLWSYFLKLKEIK